MADELKTLHAPIAHRSMTDQVSEKLRSMILSRQLAPGTRVTQAQLAEMLGVSTMPIREALLRLGAEGLINSSASRSFEIATVTDRGIRDVYWIHGVLAGELAARAWDDKSEALIKKLREEHKNYNAAHKAGDHEGLTDANRRFHAAINSVAASPTISVILRNTLHYFPDFGIEVPGWRELANRWQSELIDAFTKGDREQARQASIDNSRTSGELFVLAFWSPTVA
jgi:DNA-binding GntR family transcriptional regulator